MDYEKKYKEALERAQKFEEKYGGGYAGLIFPELAESEDERIRKAIIELLKEMGRDDTGESENVKCMIAYLEKMKEEEGYEAIPVESTLEYKLGFKAGRDFEKQKEQKPNIEICPHSIKSKSYKEQEEPEYYQHFDPDC